MNRNKNITQVTFIKKILIYMVHLLSLFELFIRHKIEFQEESKPFLISIDENTIKENRTKLQNNLNMNNLSTVYKLDLNLFNLDLSELISLFDISLLQEYISITQINFFSNKKNNKKQIRKVLCRYHSENYFFEIFEFEIDTILSSKRKRNDESLKFCFKFLRKGVKFLHLENCSDNVTDEELLSQIFGDDINLKNCFKENNITKKIVTTLKSFSYFYELSETFKKQHFLQQQIEKNILNKTQEITSSALNYDTFYKILFDRKKKHSWILQNILNSISIYNNS